VAENRGRLLLAFALVYVVWGSTYLAIKFAIETVPPFLMASVRFLVAGAMLYAWARWRGAERPTLIHWRSTAIVGAALFLAGNGGVVWSEQYVPSGLAALLVATVPLWMVLFGALFPGGSFPPLRVWVGIGLGLVGVALLARPDAGSGTASPHYLAGALALIGASILWSLGSVYSRRAPLPKSLPLTIGMQMLCGGAALGLASMVAGEPGRFDLAAVSAKSLWAVAYLLVFGALIGFSAYLYLLHNTTAARAATYAYVNPVVAMLLGWAFAGETIGIRTLVAAAIVLASVVVIVVGGNRPKKTEPQVVTSNLRTTDAKVA
jgi:drug/metabolite transporter (DMT)-like permease